MTQQPAMWHRNATKLHLPGTLLPPKLSPAAPFGAFPLMGHVTDVVCAMYHTRAAMWHYFYEIYNLYSIIKLLKHQNTQESSKVSSSEGCTMIWVCRCSRALRAIRWQRTHVVRPGVRQTAVHTLVFSLCRSWRYSYFRQKAMVRPITHN